MYVFLWIKETKWFIKLYQFYKDIRHLLTLLINMINHITKNVDVKEFKINS